MKCPHCSGPLRIVSATETAPEWLIIARSYIGLKEIPGDEDHPDIVMFHQSTSLKATDDETPWCSSFVNYCLRAAGMEFTGSAMAKSWSSYGDEVSLTDARPGDIVVFGRAGDIRLHVGPGHVGFINEDGDGEFTVLAGNQSNAVSLVKRSWSDVLTIRRPSFG